MHDYNSIFDLERVNSEIMERAIIIFQVPDDILSELIKNNIVDIDQILNIKFIKKLFKYVYVKTMESILNTDIFRSFINVHKLFIINCVIFIGFYNINDINALINCGIIERNCEKYLCDADIHTLYEKMRTEFIIYKYDILLSGLLTPCDNNNYFLDFYNILYYIESKKEIMYFMIANVVADNITCDDQLIHINLYMQSCHNFYYMYRYHSNLELKILYVRSICLIKRFTRIYVMNPFLYRPNNRGYNNTLKKFILHTNEFTK